MTRPDKALRFEFSIEVPGTPEQVWDAVATAKGISAWMMPTELEEREGGAVAFHMGPEASSEGTVTGWDPPRRIEYEEPHWAALAQQDDATVTPLVTEFLVEAKSGGTCVVHVVSSAFGSGADWEQEFFDAMATGWTPAFENLRLYLAHWPGRTATTLEIDVPAQGGAAVPISAVRAALDIGEVGDTVDARGVKAVVERVAEDGLLLRALEPVEGLLAFWAYQTGDETSQVRLAGSLFSDDAAAYVESEGPVWRAWLEGIAAPR